MQREQPNYTWFYGGVVLAALFGLCVTSVWGRDDFWLALALRSLAAAYILGAAVLAFGAAVWVGERIGRWNLFIAFVVGIPLFLVLLFAAGFVGTAIPIVGEHVVAVMEGLGRLTVRGVSHNRY